MNWNPTVHKKIFTYSVWCVCVKVCVFCTEPCVSP